MQKPPQRKRPRFPAYFEREDELQEYALTAARLQEARPETIERCTKERWDDYWSYQKRQPEPKLTKEQLADASWDYYEGIGGGEDVMILKHDLERATAIACKRYPEPVVLAAMDDLAAEQSHEECGLSKTTFYRKVEEARGLLRELLKDYYFK